MEITGRRENRGEDAMEAAGKNSRRLIQRDGAAACLVYRAANRVLIDPQTEAIIPVLRGRRRIDREIERED